MKGKNDSTGVVWTYFGGGMAFEWGGVFVALLEFVGHWDHVRCDSCLQNEYF